MISEIIFERDSIKNQVADQNMVKYMQNLMVKNLEIQCDIVECKIKVVIVIIILTRKRIYLVIYTKFLEEFRYNY